MAAMAGAKLVCLHSSELAPIDHLPKLISESLYFALVDFAEIELNRLCLNTILACASGASRNLFAHGRLRY